MKNTTKLQLRLPLDLKDWLEKDAQRCDRSMNGQVVAILRDRMNGQTDGAELAKSRQTGPA